MKNDKGTSEEKGERTYPTRRVFYEAQVFKRMWHCTETDEMVCGVE